MGYLSDRHLAEDGQGWSFSDEDVCVRCIDEPALQAAVAARATDDAMCSFCGGVPAASLDVLMAAFVGGIRREYDRAIEVLYYDDDFTSRYSKYDVVHEYGSLFIGDGLIEAVIASMADDEWVARDFAVPHHGDAMLVAWDDFCRKVKYETRYVIWIRPADPWDGIGGEVPVTEVLKRVADLFEQFDLVKTHPTLTTWWRAQTHGADPIDHSPSRLGTVPAERAKNANRMSPAGIPMFYGAADPETARAEVIQTPGSPSTDSQVTWAAFVTSREATVVDLTILPPVPSIFDADAGDQFHNLRFLHSFVTQLSSKATPEWEAVDYVPTQVLTEFLLRVYGRPELPIDGLVYNSAITGAQAVVMTVPNHGCVDQAPGWQNSSAEQLHLGLDSSSVRTAPIDRASG